MARRYALQLGALSRFVELDSVDDALAFYNSAEWKDMQPQRDKAYKVIRRYVVETEK